MPGVFSLAAAALAAISLIGCMQDAASGFDTAKVPRAELPARMSEYVLSQPVSGPTYRALKTYFPKEFDTLIARTIEIEARTGDFDSAAESAKSELSASMSSRRSNLHVAPTSDLWALSSAKSELIRALQTEGAEFCVAGQSAILPDHKFSAETQAKGWAELTSYYTALAGARDHPQQRPQPSPEVVKAYKDAVDRRVRIKYPDVDTRTRSLDVQCAIILSYYDALNDIPKDDAALFLAQVVAGS